MKPEEESIEDKINYIHELIKEIFGEAVRVDISVTNEDIRVTPEYRTNLNSYAMKTINGQWVKRVDKTY
jgi:hypothetical protein